MSELLPAVERLGRRALEILRECGEALMVHHDDADGLTSAAILSRALEDRGVKVRRVCLEKLFPDLIPRLKERGPALLLVDLGSPHVRRLLEAEPRDVPIIVIDHHDPEAAESEALVHINPELFGVSGEREASAATMAYLVASRAWGLEDPRMAAMAVVGASELPAVEGVGKMVLEEAMKAGSVKPARYRGREDYAVVERGRLIPRADYSARLTTLGAVGYYRGGPELGVRVCLEGWTAEASEAERELRELKSKLYREALSAIARGGLRAEGAVQWFDVGELFYEVGSKVLGTFTSYLLHRGRVHPDKYLVGIMRLRPEIPGLGRLDRQLSKVSVRVPGRLAAEIDRGRRPPASELLREACEALGGFADGHAYAASGVIPRGRERELVRLMAEKAGREKEGRPRTTLDEFF